MFSILKKTPDNVNAEDLETLQNELEERLVSIVTRKWELERENTSNNVTITSAGGILPKRPHQSKHRSKIVPSKFRNTLDEHKKNKKQIYRNEAPDKLWPFVEQFCATPTEEQIKELEEMIKAMDDDKDYFKIPPLSSSKKDMTSNSCKDSPSKSIDTNNPAKRRAKSRSGADDEQSSIGALTQRLVSSLIETEADGGHSNDTPSESDGGSSQQASKKKGSKSRSNKSIDTNCAKNLEKRIRQELEEHEILDQHDEVPYTSEDDEILRDLIASKHELLTIQNQNKDSMQRLLKRAKKHVELETERERLREANADVVAAYHPLIIAKQKKRNPNKAEREAAVKALKVQESIFKKCDELYLSTIVRN